jgi:hypothetical protein
MPYVRTLSTYCMSTHAKLAFVLCLRHQPLAADVKEWTWFRSGARICFGSPMQKR